MTARILLTFLLSLVGATVAHAAPNLSCTLDPAYRTGTTLTAPAYVHVHCLSTTHWDSDVRPFHDLRYLIDYGDSSCASGTGAWPNSDSGALKNRDISPVGGHVYECAGTYTMRVRACDSLGSCDTWESAAFTVQSEDAGWPGTATKCVAAVLPVAGVDGCPAGAAVQASADYDASLQLGAGTRTLYRCGETFTASADVVTADASTNGSLIGSYGTQPCKATVSKTYSGVLHYSLTSNARFGGWRVRDLIYDATTTSANDGFWIGKDGASGLNHPNVLWLRMEALHVGICPTNGNTPNTVATNERYAMVGNYCLRDVPASYTWSMWEYASLQRGLIINNFWEGLNGPSGQRIYARSYNLFAHNRLRVSGPNSVFVQSWRGHYGDLDVDTEYLVIQDNRYEDDSTETGRTVLLTVACGSTCNPPGPPGPEDGHDILFEANRFAYANTQGRDSIHTPIMTLKRDTTIRNNIIDWRAFPGAVSGVQIVSSYSDGGSTYSPAGLRTYNNTLIRSGTTSMNAFACVASGGGRDTCRNNLVYDVTDTDTSLTSGSFALTPSNNVHLNGASCPFYGATGACELTGACAVGLGVDFDCFKLRASGGGIASVKDQGFAFPETTPGYADFVYLDNFGSCRGAATDGPDGAWDIGADEYATSECVLSTVSETVWGVRFGGGRLSGRQ